jgi:hypothetical protein
MSRDLAVRNGFRDDESNPNPQVAVRQSASKRAKTKAAHAQSPEKVIVERVASGDGEKSPAAPALPLLPTGTDGP